MRNPRVAAASILGWGVVGPALCAELDKLVDKSFEEVSAVLDAIGLNDVAGLPRELVQAAPI